MKKKKKLSHIITVRLFIAVFIAFLISAAVTYAVLCKYCADQAYELLLFNTSGLTTDFAGETMQILMESSTKQLAVAYYEDGEKAAAETLAGTNYTYFVRKDGTIFLSGNQDFIGVFPLYCVNQVLSDYQTGNGNGFAEEMVFDRNDADMNPFRGILCDQLLNKGEGGNTGRNQDASLPGITLRQLFADHRPALLAFLGHLTYHAHSIFNLRITFIGFFKRHGKLGNTVKLIGCINKSCSKRFKVIGLN